MLYLVLRNGHFANEFAVTLWTPVDHFRRQILLFSGWPGVQRMQLETALQHCNYIEVQIRLKRLQNVNDLPD